MALTTSAGFVMGGRVTAVAQPEGLALARLDTCDRGYSQS
jgi:hypothetical protein